MVPALSIDSASPGGAPESGKMVEGSAETLSPPVRCASAVGLGASRSEGHGKRLRTFELQDVKSGVVVGEVHHALRIDEAVGGLDDLRPVGTRVEHALGIGRHEEPGLARLERILNVEHPDASIVIGGKDEARALEGTRPVLPEIMRPEIAAFGAVIGLGRDWHGGEAHRGGRCSSSAMILSVISWYRLVRSAKDLWAGAGWVMG